MQRTMAGLTEPHDPPGGVVIWVVPLGVFSPAGRAGALWQGPALRQRG